MYLSRGKYIFNELFIYFYNMDEKIDLISFLGRIKMTQAELAAKEGVSPKAVYAWVRDGLPALRHGDKGDIQIYYQDYVRWMIECARLPDCKVKNVPVWAYWFVRAEGWVRPPA